MVDVALRIIMTVKNRSSMEHNQSAEAYMRHNKLDEVSIGENRSPMRHNQAKQLTYDSKGHNNHTKKVGDKASRAWSINQIIYESNEA